MPIVTLDSIKKKGGGEQRRPPASGRAGAADSDDEGSDAGGGNEYYTGGVGQEGGGSGLAVLAPNEQGRGAAADPLRQLMERLQREQAAQGGPVAASGERRVVNVTVYSNGFTVDNGPLRTLEDPRNRRFMESLTQGYCPDELVQNGQPADVKLENRLEEEYGERRGGRATAPQFNAFVGTGSAVGEIALSAVPTIRAGTQGNGSPLIVNDAAGEIVKVQIKFPDGKREVAKFEKHHTVRHLIARVELLRPNLVLYHLLSADRGAPKPITPEQYDQTITDAGLAGAVVTVKEASS